MSSKTIPVDQLAGEIRKILDEYEEDVSTGITRKAVEVAEKGAQAVNSSAAGAGFGGRKYKRSWYAKVQQLSRVHADAVICSRQYRVAHLLEKSHPVGKRGHFSGRPHIKPVEDIIVREYENECRKIITKH